MYKAIASAVFVTLLGFQAFSQKVEPEKPLAVPTPSGPAVLSGAQALAAATFEAHGGEKFRAMKNLVIIGTADLNVFNQSTPATFSTTIEGDKYSFVVNSPFQPIKQIYDGKETYTSLRGFALPPITSLGFPLLHRIGETGYVVSELADPKKRSKGFRVTTPEGYYTDFYVDEKTKLIRSFESSYEFDGRTISTTAEIDKCLLVNGVFVPEKYSQRFDLGQITAYLSFKARQILINAKLAADVFQIPR